MSKGGPVTQEGKEVVRWNATRHGISSAAPVVPGWRRTLARAPRGHPREPLPVGHPEFTLAERVAPG